MTPWRRNGEQGSAAVELTILLPFLVMVMLGVVDLGRVFYAYITLASAAHEAATYTARFSGDVISTPNALATVISAESAGFLVVRLTPTSETGGNTTISGSTVVAGDRVEMAHITLTYTFQPIVPIPLQGPIAVSAAAAAPLPSGVLAGALPPTPTPPPSPSPTPSAPTASPTNTPITLGS